MTLSDKISMTNRYDGILTNWYREEDIQEAVKELKKKVSKNHGMFVSLNDLDKYLKEILGEKLI